MSRFASLLAGLDLFAACEVLRRTGGGLLDRWAPPRERSFRPRARVARALRAAAMPTAALLLAGCELPQGEPAMPQRPTCSFGATTTAGRAGALETDAAAWSVEPAALLQIEPAGSVNDAPAAPSSGQTSGAPAGDDVQITLPAPGMGGSLTANPHPMSLDAGDLGPIYVTGALSGLMMHQDHKTPGDHTAQSDISNAQVFLQKPEGWFQFYVQAGAYSLPAIGTAYVRSSDAADAFYGTLPTAYVKLVPGEQFSVMAGNLPTLLGPESTFTFQNMNVERGLLWNQENAINRGVQGNVAQGPIALSLSLNDGFYSGHYDWITGAATYTLSDKDSLCFFGGGNVHEESKSTLATPLAQNNSRIWGLIYYRTDGPWKMSPYVQYTDVPENDSIGIADDASTRGAAMLLSYAFDEQFSLAGRVEYIDSNGGSTSPNLLYGPGSDAWSLTLTPTWQFRRFFVRPEVSYVHATDSADGSAFGSDLSENSQTRVLVEFGVLF